MIPSQDGQPVPTFLTSALDYHVVKAMKFLHRSMEEGRYAATGSGNSVQEWHRLVGYAWTDLLQYGDLFRGAMALRMQAIGYSTEMIARYLQVEPGQVPKLISEDAQELYDGLTGSSSSGHDDVWGVVGRAIGRGELEQATRDRAEVVLAALFHNPGDPDALDYLPTHLQDLVREVTAVLDKAAGARHPEGAEALSM
ncbi:hypothetical protein [Streptomyces rubellomurinus]|uniref:Uncharacterized protein n=1 Tax=Streptomyces rubellomurinus (strain ATCC 31215) TaxID=359131 RepID=A0A0F2TC74_STRR3|nr:hypothetical protein [Streptomyces rubellomurinus]KJS59930.1 hypothetical protein VM95_24110 [Streptomyces rubellomurinus]